MKYTIKKIFERDNGNYSLSLRFQLDYYYTQLAIKHISYKIEKTIGEKLKHIKGNNIISGAMRYMNVSDKKSASDINVYSYNSITFLADISIAYDAFEKVIQETIDDIENILMEYDSQRYKRYQLYFNKKYNEKVEYFKGILDNNGIRYHCSCSRLICLCFFLKCDEITNELFSMIMISTNLKY